MTEDGVADRATGVVEINVDAFRAGCGKRRGEVAALVVYRGIVAKQLAALGDLGRTAGNADGPTTGDFRDLADCRAHGACRRRHHHGVAWTWLAHVQQPEIGGHAIDAGDAQREREWEIVFPDLPADGGRADPGEILPAKHPLDLVARRGGG